jgi:hypothetical protein
MMYFSSGNNRAASFQKWLDAQRPSCNDNDDPDHRRTVVAADPDADRRDQPPLPELYSPWLVSGVATSI